MSALTHPAISLTCPASEHEAVQIVRALYAVRGLELDPRELERYWTRHNACLLVARIGLSHDLSACPFVGCIGWTVQRHGVVVDHFSLAIHCYGGHGKRPCLGDKLLKAARRYGRVLWKIDERDLAMQLWAKAHGWRCVAVERVGERVAYCFRRA